MTHAFQSNDTRRANTGWCKGDISNMQDAGMSLKRSAAVAKGQRGFSCHSCMQQVVHYHVTLEGKKSCCFFFLPTPKENKNIFWSNNFNNTFNFVLHKVNCSKLMMISMRAVLNAMNTKLNLSGLLKLSQSQNILEEFKSNLYTCLYIAVNMKFWHKANKKQHTEARDWFPSIYSFIQITSV